MEEKKLTDEEIAKDIERSTGMPSYWKKIVLDLIHCLQEDNKNYDRANSELICTISEQKADIELLTKVLGSSKRKTKILDLQREIERLTEEANKDTVAYIDLCTEDFLLRKQNAELQKQVDELKKSQANKYALEAIYNNGYEQAVKDTAKEIFAELLKGENVRE